MSRQAEDDEVGHLHLGAGQSPWQCTKIWEPGKIWVGIRGVWALRLLISIGSAASFQDISNCFCQSFHLCHFPNRIMAYLASHIYQLLSYLWSGFINPYGKVKRCQSGLMKEPCKEGLRGEAGGDRCQWAIRSGEEAEPHGSPHPGWINLSDGLSSAKFFSVSRPVVHQHPTHRFTVSSLLR